jgi:DNA-binding MarR family transcriptional regulator
MASSMADQDRFARALLALARGLGRIARERARAGDVTPQQAETLQLIAERGALSTSTLATLLGIDPSTASRNLSGLEKATKDRPGLIARQKGSDDGRQTDVRLTPRGRRAAQAVGNGAASAFGSLLEKVPRAERARVIEALETVAKIVDAER